MKTMKIALCAFLALLPLISGAAFAFGASHIPCDCGQEPCACFIQIGDSGSFVAGIIDRLIDQGYLETGMEKNSYSRTVEAAAGRFQQDHGLPQTGMMDDDTLTLLIWGVLPEALDARQPVERDRPETYPDMVYVPTDGGQKRHSNPDCCDMYDPRKVSIRNAARMGYDACEKCEVEREQTLH